MNAKALSRLPPAQPVRHHCASYRGIEFHCEHPFGLSMPFKDIESAYQDRYTFVPPSKRQMKAGSVVHFAPALYKRNPTVRNYVSFCFFKGFPINP